MPTMHQRKNYHARQQQSMLLMVQRIYARMRIEILTWLAIAGQKRDAARTGIQARKESCWTAKGKNEPDI